MESGRINPKCPNSVFNLLIRYLINVKYDQTNKTDEHPTKGDKPVDRGVLGHLVGAE